MKNIKLNYSQNLLVLPQTTYLVLTVNQIYHMIYNLFTPIAGFFLICPSVFRPRKVISLYCLVIRKGKCGTILLCVDSGFLCPNDTTT